MAVSLFWRYLRARRSPADVRGHFAMGLLFAWIYRRSGNLWLPAVLHAIGNAYMVTSLGKLTQAGGGTGRSAWQILLS